MKTIIFNIFIYLTVLLLASSCHNLAHEEKLADNYYLIAVDENEQMSISHAVNDNNSSFVGIVDETVFAVGIGNNFIIAMQHPRNFPEQPDKSITNYFIIPLKNKVSKSVEKNVIGPMTKKEFEMKRKELGVPESLMFTKVFDDLE